MDQEQAVAQKLGQRIREARRAQGKTLEQLSSLSGLSAAFLSRLERGEATTSIANLIRLSGLLGIALRDLFEEADAKAKPDFALFRRREREAAPPLRAAGYSFHRLCGDLPDQKMNAFELIYPVGDHEIVLVSHEGEEVLYLLSGRIEFQIGSDRFIMEPGDCVHFNCERPHMGRNIGSEPARMLMIVSPSHSIDRRFE